VQKKSTVHALLSAMDTVPHRALLEKLTSIGLNKYLIKWVASYLTGQKQVVVNGSCLNFSQINNIRYASGVRVRPFTVSTVAIDCYVCRRYYGIDQFFFSTADLVCLPISRIQGPFFSYGRLEFLKRLN